MCMYLIARVLLHYCLCLLSSVDKFIHKRVFFSFLILLLLFLLLLTASERRAYFQAMCNAIAHTHTHKSRWKWNEQWQLWILLMMLLVVVVPCTLCVCVCVLILVAAAAAMCFMSSNVFRLACWRVTQSQSNGMKWNENGMTKDTHIQKSIFPLHCPFFVCI